MQLFWLVSAFTRGHAFAFAYFVCSFSAERVKELWRNIKNWFIWGVKCIFTVTVIASSNVNCLSDAALPPFRYPPSSSFPSFTGTYQQPVYLAQLPAVCICVSSQAVAAALAALAPVTTPAAGLQATV